MYVFNKEDIKNKIIVYKGKKKVGLTFLWLLHKMIKRFMENGP